MGTIEEEIKLPASFWHEKKQTFIKIFEGLPVRFKIISMNSLPVQNFALNLRPYNN